MFLTRWMLMVGTGLALAFTLVLGMIRAQPYDDDGIAAFLAEGGGCTAPCFMGITPNIPDRESALEILREHPWVRHAWLDNESGIINWYWSSEAPELIDIHTPGQLIPFFASSVPAIQVQTRIPLATLWIMYGQPSYGNINPQSHWIYHNFIYPEAFLSGRVALVCPGNRQQFFQSSVILFWHYPPNSLESYGDYRRFWRDYTTC